MADFLAFVTASYDAYTSSVFENYLLKFTGVAEWCQSAQFHHWEGFQETLVAQDH